MQEFRITPLEISASLWRNRNVVISSIKREVLGRYRGSALGLLWSLFNPLFMLLVYTFVFSVIFKSRWSPESDSKTEFALVLFAGMIVFDLFTKCINSAPKLILSKPNYVKKIIFPLEILTWVSLGDALFHAVVSLGVWVVIYIILFGIPHLTVLYLPIILVPYLLLIMGLSWVLASLGVYLRDTGEIIGILTRMLLFLSPIFYPASRLPEKLQPLLYINPITLIVESVRDVLYWGKAPNFGFLLIYLVLSALIAWLGFAWFQKTRKGFADVL